jgi:hypothetical protein
VPKTDPKKAPGKKKIPKSKKKKGGLFASLGSKKKKETPPPQPASGNINPTLDPELAAKFSKRREGETAVRYSMVLGVMPLLSTYVVHVALSLLLSLIMIVGN